MRKYEGLISEEREAYLNATEGMTYDEVVEYKKAHPEMVCEGAPQIRQLDMTVEEVCKKYNLVDMTDFFVSNGVKLED